MNGNPSYQAFDLAPPTLEDFRRIGEESLASLPEMFTRHLQGVIIKVEEFPDEVTEKAMQLENPYDLLGLYHGVPVGHDGSLGVQRDQVDMIFLYRRPLLAYWCDHDFSLAAIIENTLIHEIGHHFGLSDDDMERIEFGDPEGGDPA
ncbi:MAG: metallopeptidase family protein [Geminicoccaceae bacterium]